MEPRPEALANINIEDEMQRSYIDYAMSVIVGRALPDVRDGLKPGARRILFAMRGLGLLHNRPYKKCAYVVGEVLGKYHPHGDSAVYETLVRMAQDFAMRYRLVDGQGNFGSIDGDNAAAYRYTESRLTRLAEELLTDLDKNTVDMVKNYNGELEEPSVLPSRLPNLLMNGSTGIAVGMATNIPPHNLGELVDALVHLIDKPQATVEELMLHVKGPDFPTGGIICGRTPITEMYKTGRGQLKVRGRVVIEEGKNNKDIIYVTEIPYAVNKASLITNIADLVQNKVIEGIADLRDESNKDGIRIVIELKRGVIPQVVLNNLYKHTQLQTTFGAIMLAIDKGRPRTMTLKEILQCFLAHRFEVVRRRAEFELEKARARAHILEGLRIALDNMDAVVRTIREAQDRDSARTQLMERFGFSEIQANAILDMRLYQLTGLERGKIEAEYQAIIIQIAALEELLASREKLFAMIRADLIEVRGSYADKRVTEIVPDQGEVNIEDLIADRQAVITITHGGYIKRTAADAYRAQHRGGKGVAGMETKDEDYVEHIFTATAHDYLLFFTQKGRVYWEKVYEIPEAARTARGKALVNLLPLQDGEKVAAMIRVRDFPDTQSLIMATERGTLKKTKLSAFQHPRRDGIIAINIDEDDRLIGVQQTNGQNDIVLVTRKGMSIRFPEAELRELGRATRGVRGITLSENDAVECLEIVEPDAALFVCTENGYGKRTSFDEYRDQHRGGRGILAIRGSDRNGVIVGAHAVKEDDALMLITAQGQMIRMAVRDIRVISRVTQGVRLINLDEGDRLVAATLVEPDDEPETPPAEPNPPGIVSIEGNPPVC